LEHGSLRVGLLKVARAAGASAYHSGGSVAALQLQLQLLWLWLCATPKSPTGNTTVTTVTVTELQRSGLLVKKIYFCVIFFIISGFREYNNGIPQTKN
jgi:hypothetical protein